jgi:hypothetical protein
VAVPEHADRISLVFSPLVESRSVFGALSNSALTAPQWQDLITQFGQIANPTVISKPSSAAIPDPPAAPASSSTRSAPAARTTGATRRSG